MLDKNCERAEIASTGQGTGYPRYGHSRVVRAVLYLTIPSRNIIVWCGQMSPGSMSCILTAGMLMRKLKIALFKSVLEALFSGSITDR